MDPKEIDFLRGEYEFMSLKNLEEMLSYGNKQYEPEVWALLNEIVEQKRKEQIHDEFETEHEAKVESAMDGYIPLVQTQNGDEADSFGDILDEHGIDFYFEPFQAGIIRPNDPHSFVVVNVNDFNKALELLISTIPEAKARL